MVAGRFDQLATSVTIGKLLGLTASVASTSYSTSIATMNINVDRLPEYQKAELGRYIQEMEIKTSITFFNNLVDHCVDKCVLTSWGGGFSSKNLTDAETQCVSKCAEKFLKVNQRAGFRFAEFQANQNIAAASLQQQQQQQQQK